MRNLESLTIRDYAKILRRRVWYVVVTTILISGGAFAYVERMPAIYESETTIAVSSRLVPVSYIGSLDPLENKSSLTTNPNIELVQQQLGSRTFLAPLVQELGLAQPGVSLETAVNQLRTRISVTVLLTDSFRLAYRGPDPALAQMVTRELTGAVMRLNESFRNEQVHVADDFLEEQVRLTADELADAEEKLWQFRYERFSDTTQSDAAVAEELRNLEVELTSLELSLEEALLEREGLNRRLVEQRELLGAVSNPVGPTASELPIGAVLAPARQTSGAEAELETKRAELEAASIRYTAAHPLVTRLTHEVTELERRVDQLPAATLSASENDLSRANLQPAASSPAEVLPEVGLSVELAIAEIQFELRAVNSSITRMEQARAGLRQRVTQLETRLNPPPAISRQLATLTREYELAQESYQYMSDRKLEAEMAVRVDADEQNEIFRVIDEAYLPIFPVAPDRRLLRLVGCLAGLLVGVGVAIGRESLDTSLHDEGEAHAELNLPVLAGLASISAPRKKRWLLTGKQPPTIMPPPARECAEDEFLIENIDSRIRPVLAGDAGAVGESFKLIHARLSRLQKEQGIKTVLLASAVPGEGKTYASCCLAGMLARESGKKVLLVDADLRSRSATELLGLRSSRAGIDGLLREGDLGRQVRDAYTGEPEGNLTDLEQVIVKCTDLNLYVLPSGPMSDPADLMNTPELERVIRSAKSLFDWVIIDSPAVMAVSDANLLAPVCDAIVFVVQSGKTPSGLVKDAIQRIGGERVCGVLMNHLRAPTALYNYHGYAVPDPAVGLETPPTGSPSE